MADNLEQEIGNAEANAGAVGGAQEAEREDRYYEEHFFDHDAAKKERRKQYRITKRRCRNQCSQYDVANCSRDDEDCRLYTRKNKNGIEKPFCGLKANLQYKPNCIGTEPRPYRERRADTLRERIYWLLSGINSDDNNYSGTLKKKIERVDINKVRSDPKWKVDNFIKLRQSLLGREQTKAKKGRTSFHRQQQLITLLNRYINRETTRVRKLQKTYNPGDEKEKITKDKTLIPREALNLKIRQFVRVFHKNTKIEYASKNYDIFIYLGYRNGYYYTYARSDDGTKSELKPFDKTQFILEKLNSEDRKAVETLLETEKKTKTYMSPCFAAFKNVGDGKNYLILKVDIANETYVLYKLAANDGLYRSSNMIVNAKMSEFIKRVNRNRDTAGDGTRKATMKIPNANRGEKPRTAKKRIITDEEKTAFNEKRLQQPLPEIGQCIKIQTLGSERKRKKIIYMGKIRDKEDFFVIYEIQSNEEIRKVELKYEDTIILKVQDDSTNPKLKIVQLKRAKPDLPKIDKKFIYLGIPDKKGNRKEQKYALYEIKTDGGYFNPSNNRLKYKVTDYKLQIEGGEEVDSTTADNILAGLVNEKGEDQFQPGISPVAAAAAALPVAAATAAAASASSSSSSSSSLHAREELAEPKESGRRETEPPKRGDSKGEAVEGQREADSKEAVAQQKKGDSKGEVVAEQVFGLKAQLKQNEIKVGSPITILKDGKAVVTNNKVLTFLGVEGDNIRCIKREFASNQTKFTDKLILSFKNDDSVKVKLHSNSKSLNNAIFHFEDDQTKYIHLTTHKREHYVYKVDDVDDMEFHKDKIKVLDAYEYDVKNKKKKL
jgi:hypothetical protein